MIALRSLRGERIGVLGLGRSGLATARALRAGGAEPVLWDDAPAPRAQAESEGFTVRPLQGEGLHGMARMIVAPGVPHLYPDPHPAIVAAMAAGVPLDNDIGLFLRFLASRPASRRPKRVAVTGSNGKSTTCALIAHVLRASGRPAILAGNIGAPVLGLDPPGADDTLVIEISSYQAELASELACDIAAFIDFADDHLARHGGRGGYFAAKARLFDAGRPATPVCNVETPEGALVASRATARLPGPVIAIGSAGAVQGYANAIGVADRALVEIRNGAEVGRIEASDDWPAVRAPHELQNAAAALACCRALGVDRERFAAALRSFPGLPHRLELLGRAGGVAYINDSKATNPAAAARALASASRIRWILGGRAKECGITGLEAYFSRVAKAYLIGESAPELARALAGVPHMMAGDLEVATRAAITEAEAGETVLLSPACASFDQFTDYAARGDRFRELVARHIDGDARQSGAGEREDGR